MKNAVYLFSIWIFIWWALYKIEVVTYSPVFALWFGVAFDVFIVLGMLLYRVDPGFILYSIMISIGLMKLIPLLSLHEQVTRQSIQAFLGLFSVYIAFSYATGMTIPLLFKGYTDLVFYPETTLLGHQYQHLKI